MYIIKEKSQLEIAKEINLNRITVRNWLNRYNIQIRRRGLPKGKFGKDHPSWRGGKYWLNPQGYLVKKVKGKPVFLHREVYLQHNKLKEIPKGYVIHHKDRNKLNNSINNLQMVTRGEHKRIHNKDLDYKNFKERRR